MNLNTSYLIRGYNTDSKKFNYRDLTTVLDGVDLLTLGRSTGFLDINNKIVFEGDIVKYEYLGKVYKGRVVYFRQAASYAIYRNQLENVHYFYECDNIEVIGSIVTEKEDNWIDLLP